MRDPHYSVRPQNGRHPIWAKNGETKKGHITAVRNDLPGIVAHTAAGGPKSARGSVTSTGLDLRKRIPLARFAAFCAAPPLKNRTAKQFGLAPATWPELANYLISTLAPASSNFFLIVAASSLLTPSLTVFGAPSTRSLA